VKVKSVSRVERRADQQRLSSNITAKKELDGRLFSPSNPPRVIALRCSEPSGDDDGNL
jgi:hypothetical protein